MSTTAETGSPPPDPPPAEREEVERLRRRVRELEARLAEREDAPRDDADAASQRDRQRMLDTILSASPVGIGLVRDRTMVWANEAMSRIIGWTPEEYHGRSVRLLYPSDEEFARGGRGLYASRPPGEVGQIDVTMVRKNGERFDARLVARAVDPDDPSQGDIIALSDVTDHKSMEGELGRLAAIVKHAGEMVNLATPDGRMVFLNEAGGRLLGIDPEGVESACIADVVPDHLRELVEEVILPTLLDGGTWAGELQYRNLKTGGITDVFATTFSIKDPVTGEPTFLANVSLDITDRKRAEKALHESQARLSAALDASGAGAWDWNLKTGEVEYEEVSMQRLGYSAAELPRTAAGWAALAEPNDTEANREAMARHLRGETPVFSGDYRLRAKSGQGVWFHARGKVVERDEATGRATRMIGIGMDVTERKHADELLIQAEKMMTVGGLAAGVAHEINNPLAGVIQGAQNLSLRLSIDQRKTLELLAELGINPSRLQTFLERRGIPRFVEGIQEAGWRASRIVDDMLRFCRGGDSPRDPVDLHRVLDEAIRLAGHDYDLRKRFRSEEIEIRREFALDPPSLPCAASEIQQVILNLLANAAHSLADPSLAKGPTPRITVRTVNEGAYARIEVTDNGAGMSEETARRAFEPFFTTKELGEGTGLGLFVSYFLITNNHHGTIEVESIPDGETTFVIRLPRKRGSDA